MQRFWKKYREIILYLIFGVMTTVVGFGTYFILLRVAEGLFSITSEDAAYNAVRAVAQVVQWVLAVLFAYFVSKRFVFRVGQGNEVKRLAEFFAARLFSLGADSLVTFGVIFVLGWLGYTAVHSDLGFLPFEIGFTADLWGKAAAAVVVIVLNYLLSKFIVFKKERNDG